MRSSIWSGIRLYIFCYILIVAGAPMQVLAAETETELPHLIQTVTEKDIFEGMLSLGLLESKVLETPDCDKAYENVKTCVVSINMGNAYGSGVVWDMTPTQIIIVTNKHVLEYWSEYVGYVRFPQGYYIDAEVLGTSRKHDVGFLAVDNTKLDYKELESLRYVCKDMDAFNKMQKGEQMFCLGSEFSTNSDGKTITEYGKSYYKGSIGDMHRYIKEFEEYMIYGLGYARPGMSGGGTFDAKGNFIGMISGGTTNDETASIPLSVIVEEYEKIR